MTDNRELAIVKLTAMRKRSNTRHRLAVLSFVAAVCGGTIAAAQMPEAPPLKYYGRSATSRSPDTRVGTEIAAVYAALLAAANGPPKRLVGWTRVVLKTVESMQISIPVDRDGLTAFIVSNRDWKLALNSYSFLAGVSSQDLP
ncbi:MAG TPA: fibronectin type III-like domain-contianing protein [Terracidiphilus sp.]|nr:fibronectin type III-like domain-contianing protein [Terracidiphilus sp.]